MTERKQRLLQALRGACAVSEPIDLGGFQVKLRVLSSGDKDDCRMDAAAAARTRELDEGDRETWISADTVYRVLAKAIIDPETGEPVGTYEEIRASLSTPNLQRLSQEYQRLEALVAPETPAELDALYEEVKRHVGESDKALAAFLRTLDYSTLLGFAISSAMRPPN